MRENIIEQIINRTNRNLLIVNVILLAFVTLIALGSARYFSNMFQGPYKIDRKTLLAMKDPDDLSRYYVTVSGEKTLDTGLSDVYQRIDKKTHKVKSSENRGNYLFLVVDDRLLLVKSPAVTENVSFTGELVSIPKDVEPVLALSLGEDYERLKDRVIPAMLDVNDFTTWGYVGFAFVAGFFLLGSWNLMNAIKRMTDHDKHPIWKALSRFGNAKTIASEINQEVTTDGVFKLGPAMITKNWLFANWMFEGRPTPLKNLVWFYKHKTQHYVWFIPTFATHAVHYWSDEKKKCEVQMGSEKKCDELVMMLAQKAPWCYAGYSDELNACWNKQKDEMIAQVKAEQNKMEQADVVDSDSGSTGGGNGHGSGHGNGGGHQSEAEEDAQFQAWRKRKGEGSGKA